MVPFLGGKDLVDVPSVSRVRGEAVQAEGRVFDEKVSRRSMGRMPINWGCGFVWVVLNVPEMCRITALWALHSFSRRPSWPENQLYMSVLGGRPRCTVQPSDGLAKE